MKSLFKFPIFYLLLILTLASFLRFFRLDRVPPSLNWDETAIAYNAYSILQTGKDEWGEPWPLLGFESFGEYKLPLFIYATIPGVWLFGLTEFGTRFMPALFGVIGVFLTYIFTKELFKNKALAFLSAFILAIDIWHLQITRAAFEAGLAQLFLLLSIFFLYRTQKKPYFLVWSFLFACLSVYTYNSSRIFVPLFFAAVFLFNRGLFLKNKKALILAVLTAALFAWPLILNFKTPIIQGRYDLISIQGDPGFVLRINDARGHLWQAGWPDPLARLIHNKATHYFFVFGKNYLAHFSPNFLFVEGAEHTQQSIPGLGQFMIIFAPFLAWGAFLLSKKLVREKSLPAWLLFAQILVSPVAAATTMNSIPHALRTFCALPAWQIIIAYGLWDCWQRVGKTKFKTTALGLFFLLLSLNFGYYLKQYYFVYPASRAKDWQYGHKEAVAFAWKNKNDYDKVFFTRHYGEPYIFFLFHSRYSPQEYQTIEKVRARRYGWVWVDKFDKFYFPDFSDPGDSVRAISQREEGRLLFVGKPGDIPDDWTIETIYFPDGNKAFEIGFSK
ncbi:MAG: glycosyltransferase family 39 protein [Candidatus Shapirobacteria bacterium]|nr:glycosyltransferase family 39 protein [Candidatus Shapirobacteria bacterium]MDD5481842.1 glycosyltransferase family 39 protein [Candidatus Shapirobacteria bacterium]